MRYINSVRLAIGQWIWRGDWLFLPEERLNGRRVMTLIKPRGREE